MEKHKGLHVTLWVVQIFLAVMFLVIGSMKLFTPLDKLTEPITWGKEMPGLLRFVGFCEILGAIGLILPFLLRIYLFLTPLAATGFALLMICAMGFHIMRNEFQILPLNLVILAVSLFVAWGRWKKVPIPPKSDS